MKKLIYVFAILLCFLFAGKLFAVNDSCLTLYCPNDRVNHNPDFVCIDTCKDSPTYGDWFQSGTWIVGFTKFFMRDSLDVSRGKQVHINDIDSVNFPEMYSAFMNIEKKFGVITFYRDFYTCTNRYDSSYYKAPCLNIYFDVRSRTKDIEYYLNRLPYISYVYMRNYPVKSDIPASCLCLLWRHDPENGYYNACGILKDSCKDSPTYGDWYVRSTFVMRMDEYVFNKLIPKASGANVEDIDTTKYKNFRDSLMLLEKKYGRIQFFRDPSECNNESDKYFVKYPCLDISFPKYNRMNDVINDFHAYLKMHCWAMTDVNEKEKKQIIIQPNPCYDKLKIININNQTYSSTKIEIYNSFGQRTGLYEFSNELNETEIDISFLYSGLYLIKINNNLLKFIKLE